MTSELAWTCQEMSQDMKLIAQSENSLYLLLLVYCFNRLYRHAWQKLSDVQGSDRWLIYVQNTCLFCLSIKNIVVLFLRDGKPLSEDVNVIAKDLTIKGCVGANHAGQYQCQASYYRHTATLQFEIEVKPIVKPIEPGTSQLS